MLAARLPRPRPARHAPAWRAFSLIELVAVLMVMGLLASMAFLRFGDSTYATTTTDGFVRALVLDLRQARRRTISTGDNHYVFFNRSSGAVTSYTLYRDTSSGPVVVDRTVEVPSGATITTASDQWEFDFEGALTSGSGPGTITIAGTHYTWTITVYGVTGRVVSAKSAN